MNKLEKNSLKFLGSSILGSLFGGVLGNKLSSKLSFSEMEELKKLTDLFNSRLGSNKGLSREYDALQELTKRIESLPAGKDKSDRKLELIKRTDKFIKSLPEVDKRIYFKMQLLSSKIYKIKTETTMASLTVGGLIGLILASSVVK